MMAKYAQYSVYTVYIYLCMYLVYSMYSIRTKREKQYIPVCTYVRTYFDLKRGNVGEVETSVF